jgi:hypothetical protein
MGIFSGIVIPCCATISPFGKAGRSRSAIAHPAEQTDKKNATRTLTAGHYLG